MIAIHNCLTQFIGQSRFNRTATALTAQLSTLKRRLSPQKDAVTQHERTPSAANDKLQDYFSRQSDYAQRLIDAKTAQRALKEQAAAGQQVKTYSSTLGYSDSATIAAKANLDALKVEYRAFVQEVRKLSGQNAALKRRRRMPRMRCHRPISISIGACRCQNTETEIARCNHSLKVA